MRITLWVALAALLSGCSRDKRVPMVKVGRWCNSAEFCVDIMATEQPWHGLRPYGQAKLPPLLCIGDKPCTVSILYDQSGNGLDLEAK